MKYQRKLPERVLKHLNIFMKDFLHVGKITADHYFDELNPQVQMLFFIFK